ncbi:hypothetical protein [Chlorobium sp. N1]|uniref:hypothetical protein n=1 Tax=Chlorobium sp. N1 TaxID=2491138 RepID=UPI00103AB5E9|nr:hypothetical protein [Chlorobium sp. N1]TCD48524.1 hypothetical protein E0L29_01155 [Chlorobium sp. N1]
MKKTAQLALLEAAIKEHGYALRYEKGNFLGGDCRLREDRVVVVNRFLPIEGKLYTLAKVIGKINPPGLSAEVAGIIDSMLNSGLFGRQND